jgi:hypothetical protein
MATITIETNDYDSYLSVAEATAYLAARLDAGAWTSATTDDKGRALVSATRLIDRRIYMGAKTSDTQALQFPRTGLVCDGIEVASDTVPQKVLDATAELALAILNDLSTLAKTDFSEAQTRRLRAGSAEIEFFEATTGPSTILGKQYFPDVVNDLLRCFFSAPAGVGSGFVYGDENRTSDRTGHFSLTRGI